MPFAARWTNPKLFMSYRKKKIYHTYNDGHPDMMLDFHYTTFWDDTDTAYHFDVRDLDGWQDPAKRDDHKAIIREAIAADKLKFHPDDA